MKSILRSQLPFCLFVIYLNIISAAGHEGESIARLKELSTLSGNNTDVQDILRTYTEQFWFSVIPSKLSRTDTVLPYRAQTHDPSRGLINPIHEKLRPFKDHYMEVNFLRRVPQTPPLPLFFDLFSKFKESEKKLRETSKSSNHLQANSEVIKHMLRDVFIFPRSQKTSQKEETGIYIFKKFGSMGLITYLQSFSEGVPIIRHDGNVALLGGGGNIIGILPGTEWNSSRDKPLVIGAHWDSVEETSGYDDNASGISGLIEIASVLTTASCYQNKYSVIFVAFDSEEGGCYGSYEFIRSYLKPFYLDAGIHLSGAFILDTIGNFDDGVGTQNIPRNWETLAPEVVKKIIANGRRGDFISLVTRSGVPDEERLGEAFNRHNAQLDSTFPRVHHIQLDLSEKFPDLETLTNHSTFLISDHSRFWYYRENGTELSLPGALLTDTSGYRGYMQKCYHQKCDTFNNRDIHPKSIDFITRIAQAVILSVVELTGDSLPNCKPEELYAPEKEEEKISPEETQNNPPSLIEALLGKVSLSSSSEGFKKGPSLFVGNYQPTYGNVYNIGSLTVNLQAEPEDNSLISGLTSSASAGVFSQIKDLFGKRNSPIILFLNEDKKTEINKLKLKK